ncbi:MAG: ABC transporter ATP-binding protein [Chloroflexi bacterium]|nr:ABC transporter ATP-binding protein [Chloroflexota bacterium]
MSEEILQVHNLRVEYYTSKGTLPAVNNVDFSLRAGERFGLVGESGSGKSTLILAILRLIQLPGRIAAGEILLDGVDLAKLSLDEMRRKRLAEIALIPQGAMDSLNPVVRIRDQFKLIMRAHDDSLSKAAITERIAELLKWVGLDNHVADLYPHELSGGMKQRVCIAMAIALRPKVILADEPTSALDVIVQRRVMETLANVQERLGATVLLVGHDMGLMAQFVDRLGVMYGGKLVEVGPVRELFKDPLHPYTQLLIQSLPSLEIQSEFQGVPGLPFSLTDPPSGCQFHPRCPRKMDHCSVLAPQLQEVRPGHWVSCHLY